VTKLDDPTNIQGRVPPATEERMMAGDIPRYAARAIYRDLNASAACFVFRRKPDKPVESYGSGVYVRYHEHFGILTAAHVVKALRDLPFLELGLKGVKYTARIPRESVVFTSSPERKFDEKGPDLGFVRLAPSTVSYLRGPVHFVNLAFHEKEFPGVTSAPLNDEFWCHVGFPAHYLREVLPKKERTIVTRVRCICYLGGVDDIAKRGRFDYYDSKVVYDGQRFMPPSFEGMSGGALWLVRLGRKTRRPRRIVVKERFFGGIVFYQGRDDDGRVSLMRSHGPESIYNYAFKKLILPAGTPNFPR
jgi:hypothetical protein